MMLSRSSSMPSAAFRIARRIAVARRLLRGGASVVVWSREPARQAEALRDLSYSGLVSGAIVDVRRVPDVVRAARICTAAKGGIAGQRLLAGFLQ